MFVSEKSGVSLVVGSFGSLRADLKAPYYETKKTIELHN
jgi:hypothetical protein